MLYNEAAALELNNLRYTLPENLTAKQLAARVHLSNLLDTVRQTTLAPRATDASNSPLPTRPDVRVQRWQDADGVTQARVQVTFYSRENETYQLQRSLDLQVWENVPNLVPTGDSGTPPVDPLQPVRGNNGPIAFSDDLTADQAFYRLLQTRIDA